MWSIQAVQCIPMFNQEGFFLSQTIHSRSSICSFLSYHISNYLYSQTSSFDYCYYYLCSIYANPYFMLLDRKGLCHRDFVICHVTLFGCRPGRGTTLLCVQDIDFRNMLVNHLPHATTQYWMPVLDGMRILSPHNQFPFLISPGNCWFHQGSTPKWDNAIVQHFFSQPPCLPVVLPHPQPPCSLAPNMFLLACFRVTRCVSSHFDR